MTVVGWCDAYGGKYPIATFTKERKKALVERIKKRKYNFNYNNHIYLPWCAPFYDDGVICILTKQEFEDVMNDAWSNMSYGPRLIPMDVITAPAKNGVLFEKEKFANKEASQNV